MLCLKEEPLTNQHIIPKQIGGNLFARFLCKTCNDRLGYQVESAVGGDPAIRLAVEHLRPSLPGLASKILDG
ncbi:MAG: HNH endonuclease [Bacillota bacterium]